MAILCIQTIPAGIALEQVQSVTSAVLAAGGPPAGGISHAVVVDEGQIKVFDIWESEEAMNTFTQERLVPEIAKAMGVSDPSELPRPQIQIFEAYDAMGA